MIYLYVKVLHVVSVITWMAGLFYLPRLFVYHAETLSAGSVVDVFSVMEERLYRFIILPSSWVVWLSGVGLIWLGGWWDYWALIKVAFVVCLTVFQIFLGIYLRAFKLLKNHHSGKFYRLINEIPTVCLLIIVFMVIVKPL